MITQHATRNTQHATRNTQHATRNTQHATRNTQLSCKQFFCYLSLAALAATAGPGIATAQQSDDSLEEITVTGSRIKRSGVTSPTPVTIIGAEDISLSGALSLGDYLTEIPALGSTFTTANSNRFIGTVGGSFLDLRRLGTARTLVLVDGRRHIASGPGTARVDINTIPTDLVERVEVITGGASAIYGADAVTGVVNFVMKDSYEGLTARAQYGRVGEGGHYGYFGSVTGGGSFGGERGNAVVSIEYASQNQYDQDERDYYNARWRRVNNPDNKSADDGIPDRIYVDNAGLYIYSFGGRFSVGGTPYIFEPDGSFRPQNLGTDYGSASCRDCDSIASVDWGIILPEMKRLSFVGNVTYELMNNITAFLETKYVNSQATGAGSASFDIGSRGLAVIQRDNAYLSSQLGALMDANNVTSIRLARINNDLGLRGEDNERGTYRIVTGLKGDFYEGWNWEASYTYGRTSRSLVALNNRVNSRFSAAVDAVRNAAGEIVCRSSLSEGDAGYDEKYANNPLLDGCAPLDIMGEGRASAEAIDWVMADVTRRDVLTQHVVSAYVTGDLFDMPVGAVQFAGGVEYRKESSRQKPAELDQMGLTFGNALATVEGDYNVREIFGELTVPVLVNQPFAEALSIDAAIRYADYSTTGGSTSWKLGSSWQPVEDIRFRGTYAESVRAPNIGELFAPLGQNFYSGYDPCYDKEIASISDPTARATRIRNCEATGVVDPANRTQTDTSSIPGQQGGNPKLDPEKSTSWTVGAVLTPSFVGGLNLLVDYWNIDIADSISLIPVKDIKDRCVDDSNGVNNIYCTLTTRGGAESNYRYTNLIRTPQNIAAQKASGVDFEVNYNHDQLFRADDRLSVGLTGTYLINLDLFPYQEDPENKDEEAGELGDPTWLMNLNTVYSMGDWTFSHTLRFIDTMYIRENAEKETAPEYQSPAYTGTKFYSDLQIRYNLGRTNMETYVGVDNLFAANPGGYLTGLGGDSGLYDPRGRFFYGGVVVKF